MKSSKFIQVLASLSPKETKRFSQYVHSPYFNTNKRLIKLLTHIIGFHPQYPAHQVERVKVYTSLFPSAGFSEQKFRLDISQLYRLLKSFLAQQEYESGEGGYQKNIFLLTQLYRRRLANIFDIQVKKLQQSLVEMPFRGADYHWYNYQLANEANAFYGSQQLRVYDQNLQQMIDHLDMFFLTIKLQTSCEMLNRMQLMKGDYELNMIEELLSFLETKPAFYEKVPAIGIYYQILNCLINREDEQHYQQLVELLQQHSHKFPITEAQGMYKYAQNYCIRHINRGNTHYMAEVFRLYKMLAENGLLLDAGQLPHSDYKNIVTAGLRTKEFEWVENFMDEYKDKVDSAYRENVYNFSLASYYFETQQQRKAIRYLQSVTFTDVFYQLSARELLIKSMFETRDYESLFYQIDALTIFLKRNKEISSQRKENHLNFLKTLKRLVRLSERAFSLPKTKVQAECSKIREELAPMSQLSWLKLKLDEMI